MRYINSNHCYTILLINSLPGLCTNSMEWHLSLHACNQQTAHPVRSQCTCRLCTVYNKVVCVCVCVFVCVFVCVLCVCMFGGNAKFAYMYLLPYSHRPSNDFPYSWHKQVNLLTAHMKTWNTYSTTKYNIPTQSIYCLLDNEACKMTSLQQGNDITISANSS